ncbi:MAG TPA: glutaredoxin family protein [Steroidobacteraceae bacterium]
MAEPASRLVLFVREGCHLCEQFLMELSLEIGPAVERLAVVDVDDDADLAIRYGLRVPVLTLDEELLCEGVLDAARLRQALRL